MNIETKTRPSPKAAVELTPGAEARVAHLMGRARTTRSA